MHEVGIVHGNLTCENILLADRTILSLKIGGFGRVKHFHEKRRNSHGHESGFAAPVHVAPGSTEEGASRSSVDIWGVACVLIEMLHEGDVTDLFDTSEEILQTFSLDFESIIKWFIGGDNILGANHLAYFAKNWKVIECIKFMQSCLQKIPSNRPTATDLLKSPFIAEQFDDLEGQTEDEVLKDYKILSEVTSWMSQAVDPHGTAVILTRREIQLNNWMDEFVAVATVLAFTKERNIMPTHPQMMKRLECWVCRDPPNTSFLEKVTIISSWEYCGPCKIAINHCP